MNNDPLDSIKETLDALIQVKNTAYSQYSALVDSVLRSESTDEVQIERIMDGLLDFCDEERFLQLYKKLCRHVFYRYPQLVGEHVALYRVMFEPPEGNNEK